MPSKSNSMFKKSLSDRSAPCTPAFALLLCGVVLGLAACAGSGPDVKLTAYGTLADVSSAEGKLQNVELLALQNDTLFVLGDSFTAIPAASLKTVSLNVREDRSWIYIVVFAQLLPSAAFMVLDDNTAQFFGVVMGALGIGTWAAWELSIPQSVFRFPLDEAEGRDFALHFRFPYGANRGQLEQIRTLARRSVP